MADNETRMARALESLAKSSDLLAKTGVETAKAIAKLQHPAFAGKEITDVRVSEDDISTTIVLGYPDVDGVTSIYRQDDGFLRIEILVEPENSERLMELVSQLPVNQFTLQAVEPN